MRILREPAATAGLPSGLLRAQAEKCFVDMAGGEPFDANMGKVIVAEPGDTIPQVEEACGYPLQTSLFDDSRFGDAGFYGCWEWVAFHAGQNGTPGLFEIVALQSDSGYAAVVLVPQQGDIDMTLLALCAAYATATPEPACG